jgi:hypothetical protein
MLCTDNSDLTGDENIATKVLKKQCCGTGTVIKWNREK